MFRKTGLIGAGNLGLSIGYAFKKAGMGFFGVYDSSKERGNRAAELLSCSEVGMDELAKNADLLLVAVPDRSIAGVYREIKDTVKEDMLLVHFSGCVTSDIFGKATLRLSAHPAQTFPYPRLEESKESKKKLFRDVYFAIEGTSRAIELFEPVIKSIGGRPFIISKENKPLYHAMCVAASNLLIGLLKSAEDLGKQIGLKDEQARTIALHFAHETIANALSENSLVTALSGPVVRGDAETVAENLRTLAKFPVEGEVYRLLSMKLLELALQKGLPVEEASKLRRLLESRE